MKSIMAGESSLAEQGVPSFSYFPADKATPLLFALTRRLDDLETELPKIFAGRTLSMESIFQQHNIDTPYIEKNYKIALGNLEAAGSIVCSPAAKDRKIMKGERTFANHVLVTFPGKM